MVTARTVTSHFTPTLEQPRVLQVHVDGADQDAAGEKSRDEAACNEHDHGRKHVRQIVEQTRDELRGQVQVES